MWFKSSFLLLSFSLNLNFVYSSFCFWDSGCPYKFFASKTPYNAVRGDIRDSVIKVKGCEPIAVWALHRHGKRNPNSFYAGKMEDALVIRNYIEDSLAKGKCSLCAQDVENLQSWPIDKKVFMGRNELSNEGYQEMFGLGNRLKTVFPNLLSSLKGGEYIFRPSDAKLEDSAKAFVEGIGGKGLKIEKAGNDDLMTSYATCTKHQKDVKENSKTYEEASKYRGSSEYLATKDRIQRRAGIDIALSDDNITALYDLCRYTWSGIDIKPSPWCALFTSEDLQVLEYLEDLKQYYRDGYGTPANKMFGHIPLADLLKKFMDAKEGGGKKITAYFSHKSTLDMTITALGMFKDKAPLSGTKRNKDRLWRSSKLSNFASNIMAVLSRCTIDGAENYNVVFYWNEEPIKSVCAQAICPWEEFENKMKTFVDTTLDYCELDAKLDQVMNK